MLPKKIHKEKKEREKERIRVASGKISHRSRKEI